MKTAENYIKEMENSNLLISRELTFKEYAAEIVQFQEMICRMIAGDAYHSGMRIEEAMFIMESAARKKGVRKDPAVHKAVLTLKELSKEMAITMSGVKGEKLVSRTLEFLNRPEAKVFKNVYITDGVDETELDDVVLTNNGVIILEVKKVKSNITLTEDGRMVFAGDESYDRTPLAYKMSTKRRLLKEYLKKEVVKKGLEIPVYVDSFIVFSAPKDQYIKVDDRSRRDKYCFRTNLNKKIENYLGCAYYNDEQLSQLGEILAEMESNVRRFATDLDYDEVRRNIAGVLEILQNAEPENSEKNSTVHTPANNVATAKHSKDITVKTGWFKNNHGGYVAAGLMFGLVGTTLASVVNSMFDSF